MLNYILEKNGLTDKVTIVWHTEHSELATLVAAGEVSLAMLPEPHVTSAILKNSSLKAVIDLTSEWDKVSDGDAVQGCVVVSKKAITEHKAKVDAFLDKYAASVDYVNNNVTEAAAIIADLGIVGAAKAADKAHKSRPTGGVGGADRGGKVRHAHLPFFKLPLHRAALGQHRDPMPLLGKRESQRADVRFRAAAVQRVDHQQNIHAKPPFTA
jgi:ABC-type nitrate/sulfonate/bicarbonate transport system substrate-binding protein